MTPRRPLMFMLALTAAAAAPLSAAGEPARSPYWLERTSQFQNFAAPADVVMLGDSLTDGAEWAELFPDQRIVNRGIDGDTSDGVLARLNPVLTVRPKVVFLMIGINDFADARRSSDAVLEGVRAIVRRLLDGGADVVLQSTLPCNVRLGAWKSCADINARVRALNGRMAELAGARVHWVDLAAELSGADGLKPAYTFDGVHLNGAGYLRWRDAIAPFMPAASRCPCSGPR